jgi:hypothetical protein
MVFWIDGSDVFGSGWRGASQLIGSLNPHPDITAMATCVIQHQLLADSDLGKTSFEGM